MLNVYVLSSLVIAVCLIVLSVFVYTRNPKSLLNRLFFLFSFTASIWLVANYLAGDPHLSREVALVANKVVFLFGDAAVFSFLLFIRKLINKRSLNKYYYLLNVAVLVSTTTPLIVDSVVKDNGTYAIKFGFLSAVYFAVLLCNCLVIFRDLIKTRKKSRGLQKDRIHVILMSLLITLTVIISVDAILPFTISYYGLQNVGPFFMTFLVVGVAFSIIRHKLFDIKLAVTRSVAYVLTLTILALLFIIPIVILTTYVTHVRLSKLSIGLFVIVLFVLAFAFQPLIKYFGKLSNRIFYRNYYEIQDVLDTLGDLLVASVDPDKIRSKSKEILSIAIKPTFIDYLLYDSNEKNNVLEALVSLKPNMLVTDELAEGSHTKSMLMDKGIGMAVRLRTREEDLGFIVVGYKTSGQIFSDTDKRLLVIAADEIAIGLQNALRFKEIEQFNVTLQERVDQATLKLRRVNNKLRALDEAKDDFVSMASHQLRTPLTSVKGNISLVLEGDAGKISALQTQLLQQAFASSQRMVFLIADLLNVSRLKTGKFVIERAPVDLSTVVDEEVNQLQDSAKSRNLVLSYIKPDHITPLMLDDTKTRQVIMNFIDNAIYYTPSGGRIDVVLSESAASVECRVIDNGIGVPKSEQHHLFTKFYRAGNARQARPDGTGLGLFMAKKVIVSEGGAIIFDTQEGKGSTFGFSFPKALLSADKKVNEGPPVKQKPALVK